MDRIRRCLALWMVASTIHLPMPVCQSADLNCQSIEYSGAIHHAFFDVEQVLSGCQLVDDENDGPVDRDRDQGVESPFGPHAICTCVTSLVHSPAQALVVKSHRLDDDLIQRAVSEHEHSSVDLSGFVLSFEKSCRSGLAVLRC